MMQHGVLQHADTVIETRAPITIIARCTSRAFASYGSTVPGFHTNLDLVQLLVLHYCSEGIAYLPTSSQTIA